ncbi:hypothetical protein AB5I41_07500 [Sphingomonas sp. MMS24-JH45]
MRGRRDAGARARGTLRRRAGDAAAVRAGRRVGSSPARWAYPGWRSMRSAPSTRRCGPNITSKYAVTILDKAGDDASSAVRFTYRAWSHFAQRWYENEYTLFVRNGPRGITHVAEAFDTAATIDFLADRPPGTAWAIVGGDAGERVGALGREGWNGRQDHGREGRPDQLDLRARLFRSWGRPGAGAPPFTSIPAQLARALIAPVVVKSGSDGRIASSP